MKCVVTGAAGFIGSTLCERLLRDGHSVTGIDCFVEYYPRLVKEGNLAPFCKSPRFRFVEIDLGRTDCREVLDGAEWVFHQAAQAGVRASWGQTFESYCSHNVLATQRLLEACKGRSSIQKVVYASSSSVYGNAESLPTPESVRPQPVSPYGVTKLAAEHLMVLYAKEFGVPTVSLRYFTVYGPRQRPDMAFHRFIRAGLQGEPIVLYGTGEQSRDFTFIDDIVECNLLAAEGGMAGTVYNVGGGTQASMNSVIKIIDSHLQRLGHAPLQVNRESRQHGDASHTSAECSLVQSHLGFRPRVSLSDGIGREAEWLQDVITVS